MMYDYESDLIEFWGKVIFFGAFILIWALVFYFVMYSFPFLFISPLTFSITLPFFPAYVFFTRFFTHGQTTTPTYFCKNSFRKEISIKDLDSRRGWRSGLVGVCQSDIFPCLSLPLFFFPVMRFLLLRLEEDKQTNKPGGLRTALAALHGPGLFLPLS